MQNIFNELTIKFKRNGGRLSTNEFQNFISKRVDLYTDIEQFFIILQASGYPISRNRQGFKLDTIFKSHMKIHSKRKMNNSELKEILNV